MTPDRMTPSVYLVASVVVLAAAESSTWNEWPPFLMFPEKSNAGSCKPPPVPSAAVGLKGYRRYHANDSLIGKPVPCTYDEKVCFRYNLVFEPSSDRCQAIGDNYCTTTVNSSEFVEGSGRVIGVCEEYEDPCPGYRMAYDNRCYHEDVVRDVICGCGTRLTRHFLGGAECRRSAPTPIKVQQPEEVGQCLIPDFRFPKRSVFYEDPLGEYAEINLKCSAMQAECLSKSIYERNVWVVEYEGCFPILQRGPCPEDHIVALDASALLEGRAEAECVHARGGCSLGYKRMAFDGQCHEDRSINIASPINLFHNAIGLYGSRSDLNLLLNSTSGACFLFGGGSGYGGGTAPKARPPCGSNNGDQCWLYEVESEPPVPLED